jgi:hypothetical protein
MNAPVPVSDAEYQAYLATAKPLPPFKEGDQYVDLYSDLTELFMKFPEALSHREQFLEAVGAQMAEWSCDDDHQPHDQLWEVLIGQLKAAAVSKQAACPL